MSKRERQDRKRGREKKTILDNGLGVEGTASIDTSGIHNSAREAMIKWMSKKKILKTAHENKR